MWTQRFRHRTATFALLLGGCSAVYVQPELPGGEFGVPAIEWNPRRQVCYRAATPPRIDGDLSDPAWAAAAWTEAFVDIGGGARPAPGLSTRAKLLWDDECLYIAADLEDPDVSGTVTERDAVVFEDNDFEVFIDPDGDTHGYYEIEVNALGTVWDLFLPEPYRTGGKGVDAWDAAGLRTAVRVDGTLNRPGDTDRGWTVEMAVPWRVLGQGTWSPAPPRAGDRWRLNFARVHWSYRTSGGTYEKVLDPATGKPVPPANWSWSPQGLVDMHYPEMWGFVQFSDRVAGRGEEAFVPDPADAVVRVAWTLYYAQQNFRESNSRFSNNVVELGLDRHEFAGVVWPPRLYLSPHTFQAYVVGRNGAAVRIDDRGRLRVMHRP